MKQPDTLLKTNGGVIAVAGMRVLAEYAAEHARGLLRFTADQCIAIPGLPASQMLRLRQQLAAETIVVGSSTPNIVTTAPVAGIGAGCPWLRPGVFADILEGFKQPPQLRVVIADTTQSYMPLPPADILLTASPQEDAWRIVLHGAGIGANRAPGVLRGIHIGEAMRRIEQAARALQTPLELADLLADLLRGDAPDTAISEGRYRLPPDALSLAEPTPGWDARFLQDLCLFALERGRSTMGITPARGLLLQGADAKARDEFDDLCARRRHAPETNPWRHWMVVEAGLEREARALAEVLMRHCSVNPGLALGVSHAAAPAAGTDFTVRPLRGRRFPWSHPQYKLEGRGAAEGNLDTIAQVIVGSLVSSTASAAAEPLKSVHESAGVSRRQCGECLSEYDPRYGDPMGDIPEGTPFEALPQAWTCPVCGAPSSAYRAA